MSMLKRGVSHTLSIVECSSGDDMVRCPHCEKFISAQSTKNNDFKCRYCMSVVEALKEQEKEEVIQEEL